MVVGKFTLFCSIYASHHNTDTGQTHDMRRDGKMGSVYQLRPFRMHKETLMEVCRAVRDLHQELSH